MTTIDIIIYVYLYMLGHFLIYLWIFRDYE